MGLNVPNTGPEFLAKGGVILYLGLDVADPSINTHISMSDANAITQNELASLDNKIRTKPVSVVIIELNKPHLKPWWERVRLYLQSVYPKRAPVDVFIGAWLRNA